MEIGFNKLLISQLLSWKLTLLLNLSVHDGVLIFSGISLYKSWWYKIHLLSVKTCSIMTMKMLLVSGMAWQDRLASTRFYLHDDDDSLLTLAVFLFEHVSSVTLSFFKLFSAFLRPTSMFRHDSSSESYWHRSVMLNPERSFLIANASSPSA